jgi:hypothetical protein
VQREVVGHQHRQEPRVERGEDQRRGDGGKRRERQEPPSADPMRRGALGQLPRQARGPAGRHRTAPAGSRDRWPRPAHRWAGARNSVEPCARLLQARLARRGRPHAPRKAMPPRGARTHPRVSRPFALPAPSGAMASSAASRSMPSKAPLMIRRFCGSSSVTACENSDIPTIASTRSSRRPCRTTISEAMECPKSATRGWGPVSRSGPYPSRARSHPSAAALCHRARSRPPTSAPDYGHGLRNRNSP